MTDPANSESPLGDEVKMSERELEIHRVLSVEDRELAGLLFFLLRAMREVERPGGIHMLGHAGRELSLGVIRYLSNDSRPLTEEELSGIDEKEKHRNKIARALRLQPLHPSVTAWHKTHMKLVSYAHYDRTQSAKPSRRQGALAAAEKLLSLLWSRTGQFFGTKADVTRLLSVDAPSESDIDALRASLSRPAVRWDFFKRLENSRWVSPLLQAGFFKNPPDILPPDENGRQKWDGWAEGEYLRRMARAVPSDVRDALITIPVTLRNPYVWDAAAEAAKLMTADIAVTLVPNFREALKIAFPVMIQETLCELAIILAQAGKSQSFGLAHDVLRVVEGKKSIEGIIDGTEKRDAGLFGLDEYEAERLIPQLVTALEITDPKKALKFFVSRLDEALRIEEGDPATQTDWDRSQHWCPDLNQAQDHHGFKEQIAIAIASLAAHAAAKGPEEAQSTLDFLCAQPWHIYKRQRLHVLAEAGQYAPQQLSAVIADTDLVRSEYPGIEYQQLLRKQFERATPESQQALILAYANGAGTDEEIRNLLREDESIPSAEEIRQFRVRWQRKRLRRFGNAIPVGLKELANRLDADDSVPKPTGAELELEDTGHSGSFGWSGGPYSPITTEALELLTPDELLAYIRQYKPTRENFDSPTPAGLAVAIASRVRTDPVFGVAFSTLLRRGHIDPIYPRAVLQGFVGAAEEGRVIPWSDVLALTSWIAARSNRQDVEWVLDHDYGDRNWRWAQREAAKLIGLAAERNLAGADDTDALWDATDALLRSTATWDDQNEEPLTMSGALSASLNTVAGEAVNTFMQVALWHYRLAKTTSAAGSEEPGDAAEFSAARFRGGIETILSIKGASAHAGLVRLGTYLPQAILVDRDGILENASALFEGGFLPPMPNYVWGGYITRANLFNSVFTDLRSWYVEAAKALPSVFDDGESLLEKEKDATWSTTRHLASHCLIATLRGLIGPTDEDQLLATVYQRSLIAERSHTYWEVFSGWEGPEGSVPGDMVERLLRFWEWRLDILAAQGPKERKAEAGALGWFAVVNALPADRALPLLSRTAEQAEGAFPMDHTIWNRMSTFVQIDLDVTIAIVARMIRAELSTEYPHCNIADIGPVLTPALQAPQDGITYLTAKDLVNLLGDHGFTEFGTLL